MLKKESAKAYLAATIGTLLTVASNFVMAEDSGKIKFNVKGERVTMVSPLQRAGIGAGLSLSAAPITNFSQWNIGTAASKVSNISLNAKTIKLTPGIRSSDLVGVEREQELATDSLAEDGTIANRVKNIEATMTNPEDSTPFYAAAYELGKLNRSARNENFAFAVSDALNVSPRSRGTGQSEMKLAPAENGNGSSQPGSMSPQEATAELQKTLESRGIKARVRPGKKSILVVFTNKEDSDKAKDLFKKEPGQWGLKYNGVTVIIGIDPKKSAAASQSDEVIQRIASARAAQANPNLLKTAAPAMVESKTQDTTESDAIIKRIAAARHQQSSAKRTVSEADVTAAIRVLSQIFMQRKDPVKTTMSVIKTFNGFALQITPAKYWEGARVESYFDRINGSLYYNHNGIRIPVVVTSGKKGQ